jgi:hypothetical protein
MTHDNKCMCGPCWNTRMGIVSSSNVQSKNMVKNEKSDKVSFFETSYFYLMLLGAIVPFVQFGLGFPQLNGSTSLSDILCYSILYGGTLPFVVGILTRILCHPIATIKTLAQVYFVMICIALVIVVIVGILASLPHISLTSFLLLCILFK